MRAGSGDQSGGSLHCRLAVAQRLDAGAAFLAFQAPHLGAQRRPGRAARRRPHCSGADQFDEPFERVVAVALLGAVALGGDHENAVPGQALAGKPLQPRPHLVMKRGRMAHVEAQLHRGRELFDVLAARPRRPDEGLGNLALVDADGVVDADHERLGAWTGEGDAGASYIIRDAGCFSVLAIGRRYTANGCVQFLKTTPCKVEAGAPTWYGHPLRGHSPICRGTAPLLPPRLRGGPGWGP